MNPNRTSDPDASPASTVPAASRRRFVCCRANLEPAGRWVRGLGSVACLAAAGWTYERHPVAALVLLAAALFMAFEACRGWCLVRACGIKTKL